MKDNHNDTWIDFNRAPLRVSVEIPDVNSFIANTEHRTISALVWNIKNIELYTVREANPDSVGTMHSTRESGLASPTVYTNKTF